jgi:hypothetical protein
VTGQVVPVNPAASVRGPRYSVSKGLTPVLDGEEAHALRTASTHLPSSAFATGRKVIYAACHHNLEHYLDEYIEGAGLRDDQRTLALSLRARKDEHAHV